MDVLTPHPLVWAGRFGVPLELITIGQAMVLWMTLVPGKAASAFRKAVMLVGLSEGSAAMVSRPVRVPPGPGGSTSALFGSWRPITLARLAGVLNAFSVFLS